MGTSKLKIERVKSNLTQEELAKIIGVTRQTIGLIEKGKYNPSLSLCLQICYTLNKSLDDIFWTEKENDKGDFK
ncbi:MULTISPECIES: helix-turn-helix transcriptional regulator [Bacillus cereus group]|uniref:Transcriptional regulator n=1 Tax=Bacillus thuringiensis TaxID=1428 RepID=A0A9X6ZS46_BACTU|nr:MULTISPECIES: helix-turn-helix transcriptional regulator [Bacillus cereus group]MEE3949924.1 helix-turn-helix transcriptional regulator [Bacillus wiedmannii]ASZ69715.1 transcriptional regulator [Bacillus cereus]EJR29663.1 hypothetical protein IIE_04903 [Bacillus cereus VD045]MBG9715252.1 Cro/Cl family transcriptional regulator [Bacillus cereus]MCU4812722.1 helix-turn-helix transcriptional regulator [Bacillus cereus]